MLKIMWRVADEHLMDSVISSGHWTRPHVNAGLTYKNKQPSALTYKANLDSDLTP